jgi:ABC-type multidrug transport system permease subunit
MNKSHALLELTRARAMEFFREPEVLFWSFAFPLLLAAGLGFAFRDRPAEVLKIVTVDGALKTALGSEPLLDVQQLSEGPAGEALKTGKAALLVAPAPGGGVVYRYDETNPEGRTARMLADRAVQRAAGRVDPVKAHDTLVTEPGSRYIDFLLPGLLGMNVMSSAIWGMGFPIVDARKKKLLKRLIATPLPRSYYLLSFGFSHLGMLIAEVFLLVGFGVVVFHVPLRGSILELFATCLLGLFSFGALGLLMASRAQTLEAVSGLMNLTMMPMWILSGVFFSAQRFPDWLQPFIQVLPLTAINEALRANMLQGAGFTAIWNQIAILGAWMVVCFALAFKIFRWR